MRRSFLTLLVVASILFQSMASAGQGLVEHISQGLDHAVMHWEKTAHHHHDDDSFHQDQSDQSSRHLQADNALTVVALPSFAFQETRVAVPILVNASTASVTPAPVLDGPTRPPRIAG
jgi:hypothetical protein